MATRVLTPFQAVLWAAFFNFVSAFTFGTGVAKTVGKGFVDLALVTPYVILAGLLGAIVWDLITWWLGLPTSSSHALIGGYAGAAMARVAHLTRLRARLRRADRGRMAAARWLFIVIAPLIGLVLAYTLMIVVYWIFRHSSPSKMDHYFRKLQLVSAAPVQLLARHQRRAEDHGHHHAACCSPRELPASVSRADLGDSVGARGHRAGDAERRLAHRPHHGRAAHAAEAAQRILRGNRRGGVDSARHRPALPVSTTHVIAGAIAGVGTINRFKAVRWGIATNIVWAWVLTIPAAATDRVAGVPLHPFLRPGRLARKTAPCGCGSEEPARDRGSAHN